MAGSVQVQLPNGTTLVLQAFANAAYVQRVTVTVPGQQPYVFSGSGFYDTLIGSATFTTAPGSGGVVATVAVDHSSDGGQTWQPSLVDTNTCVIQYYQLVAVASDDSGGTTWDDATTYFSWTVPPSG